MNGGDASGQPILDLPENTSSKVDVMLHQSHSAILRPAFSVVVSDHILVVRIWIFSEVALNELPCFIAGELEQDVEMVHVSVIYPDRMLCLQLY